VVSPDFRDLLSAFNAHRVDYLVVGAHALAAHVADVDWLEKHGKR
jgi:hypothetical protein